MRARMRPNPNTNRERRGWLHGLTDIYFFTLEYARYYLEKKKTEDFYVMSSTDAAGSTRGTAALDLCPSSPRGIHSPRQRRLYFGLTSSPRSSTEHLEIFYFFCWMCQAPPLKTSSCFICRMMLKLLAGGGAERLPCLSLTHTGGGGV